MSIARRLSATDAVFSAIDAVLPPTDGVVALDHVSWATFTSLASESRGGRLAYDRGRLEIMSPSLGHENVKSLLCRFIEMFAEERGIDLVAAGSVTLARNDLDRGIEADACYFFGSHARLRSRDAIDLAVDPPPELAVEVDMSRSSVNKLAIYAALGVAEIWRTDGKTIEILQLGPDGYRLAAVSGLLPGFPRAEAMRLLVNREAMSDTQAAHEMRAACRSVAT
jgi:Uma2 family endonuclease